MKYRFFSIEVKSVTDYHNALSRQRACAGLSPSILPAKPIVWVPSARPIGSEASELLPLLQDHVFAGRDDSLPGVLTVKHSLNIK
jgi:hypothetical protein